MNLSLSPKFLSASTRISPRRCVQSGWYEFLFAITRAPAPRGTGERVGRRVSFASSPTILHAGGAYNVAHFVQTDRQ